MNVVVETVGGGLLILGSLVVLVAALGLLRFPDLFTRMHAAGVADTLGVALVLVGLVFLVDAWTTATRFLLILGFVWFTSPTACHALARSALASGLRPKVDGDAEPAPTERVTDLPR